MKIACFVFIVHILILMTQPCDDLIARGVSGSDRTHVSRHDTEQTTEETSDDCSPFCVCSCCNPVASHVITFSVTRDEELSVINDATETFINTPLLTYANSIWQPPKI